MNQTRECAVCVVCAHNNNIDDAVILTHILFSFSFFSLRFIRYHLKGNNNYTYIATNFSSTFYDSHLLAQIPCTCSIRSCGCAFSMCANVHLTEQTTTINMLAQQSLLFFEMSKETQRKTAKVLCFRLVGSSTLIATSIASHWRIGVIDACILNY